MSDLDTRLADLNNDVPAMTDEAFAAGRTRLHEAMTTRPRRRLPVLVAAAAAAALAVTTTVLVTGEISPASVNTPADLVNWAQTLEDDPPRVGPGQYLYERIQSTMERDLDDDPRFRVRSTSTGEQWIPHDYRDEWRLKVGGENVEFVKGTETGAKAEGITIPAPSVAVDMTAKCGNFAAIGSCDGEGWGTTGSPSFYDKLTGDPWRLYAVLRDRAGDSNGLDIFAHADRLLQPNVPNDFKATLFQAMSHIPGLTVTDDARTADGRTGIGLRVESNGTVREQIVDRVTGDLLQGRFKDAHTEAIGTVTYGVTDSPQSRPN